MIDLKAALKKEVSKEPKKPVNSNKPTIDNNQIEDSFDFAATSNALPKSKPPATTKKAPKSPRKQSTQKPTQPPPEGIFYFYFIC